MESAAQFTSTHHHALSLDIHILSLLLQRNYHQHHRCIYFRRLSMALSALRRLPSFEEVHGWVERWKCLVQLFLDQYGESTDAMRATNSRTRKQKEEQWTLEHGDDDHNALKIVTHHNVDDDLQQQQQLQQIPIILQQLKGLATQTLPQIISRIVHATSPVLHEISRGYFVPFLTVALACLGRIQSLLLRMGRDIVTVLRETVPQLRGICKKTCRVRGETVGIMDWNMLQDLLMPSTFSVAAAKGNGKQASAKTEVAASQEWNSLLTCFLESSQDELTKQMNEFVKGKRWGDAMSQFGLGKDVSRANTPKVPEKQLLNDQEEDCNAGECDGPLSNDEKEAQPFLEEDKANGNDTGELVNYMCDSTKQNKFSPGDDAADDNMARIIQREKVKRLATTNPVLESSVSKKKRRKKKRGSSTTAGGTINGNEERLQNYTDRAKPVQDEMVSRQTNSLDDNKPQAEDESLNKRNQGSASSMDGENDSSAAMPHNEDHSDVAKHKKSKKKSSKKAKKQKRRSSTNVIDNIFGS